MSYHIEFCPQKNFSQQATADCFFRPKHVPVLYHVSYVHTLALPVAPVQPTFIFQDVLYAVDGFWNPIHARSMCSRLAWVRAFAAATVCPLDYVSNHDQFVASPIS